MKKIWTKSLISLITAGSVASIIPIVSCAKNNQSEFWLEQSSATINDQNEFVVVIHTTKLKSTYIRSDLVGFYYDDEKGYPVSWITPKTFERDETNNKIVATFDCSTMTTVYDRGIRGQIKLSAAPDQEHLPRPYYFKSYFFEFTLYPHDNFAMPQKHWTLSSDHKKLSFNFMQNVDQKNIEIKSAFVSFNDTLSPPRYKFEYQYAPDGKTVICTFTAPDQATIPPDKNNCCFRMVYRWKTPSNDDIWFSYKFTSLSW